MNALGIGLFWCVAQVTLLSVVAGLLYCALRRFGPAVGAFVSLTALVFMSAATVTSFSPWPNWMPVLEAQFTSAEPDPAAPNTVGDEESSAQAVAQAEAHRDQHDESAESPIRAAMAAFWDQLRTAEVTARNEANAWRWSSVLAAAVLISVVVGLLRLIVGIAAVRRYRHTSVPISEPAILELLDILAAELGCAGSIELRESSLLTGAATIGWRRPLILLSPAWKTWDERDRRAVLAHELAHIHHNDYLTWLAAQLGLALHFYHPLAHWLCACLRLDQELVADSTAARVAGGEQSYLQSLAQIALRQSEPQVSWAAQTFLPTRRTFLRRIEMLRDSKQWLRKPPRSLRWLAVTVLLIAGLIILGLRGPAGLGPQVAGAQPPKPPVPAAPSNRQSDVEPFSLSQVPRDTMALVAIRPADLLRQPALQPISKMLRSMGAWEKNFGIQPDQLQSLHFLALPLGDRQDLAPTALIMRSTAGANLQKLADALAPQSTKDIYGTQEYFRQRNAFYYQPDARTLVFSHDEGVIRRCIVAGQNGAKSAKWAASWSEVANKDAAALVNTVALRSMSSKVTLKGTLGTPTRVNALQLPQIAPFAPLWDQCDIAVAGLQVGEALSLKVVGTSANADDAKRVHDTLKSAVTLAQNVLSKARQNTANSRAPDGPLLLGSIDIADELLENVKIELSDTQVTLTADTDPAETVQLVSMVVPAITSAHEAARTAQAMNNMKQIGLAYHNYHDANQSLPPAVIYSPHNVPRSWRVELLPYLAAGDLYSQYRKDEPWDSEQNLKVLAQMPAVFRDPADAANSTNTSYFVFTGAGTAFNQPVGSKFQDITDGTSNVLLSVQAKRNVPWTKPEDIPYAPDKPLPKLGGWIRGSFLVGLWDGSVRKLPDTIDEKILRMLITIGDGQPIPPIE